MNQGSLFVAKAAIRAKASPMAAKVETFRLDNLACARKALADPDKYGHLQEWARLVLKKHGLLTESEAV
jgi:hypothetical protein